MARPRPHAPVEEVSFFHDRDLVLSRYHSSGMHIERGLWSEAECHRLIEASHSFASYKEGKCKPVMMPHREHPVFLEALKHPKIVEIMETLVAGKVSGLQSELFFGKPGTPGFSPHQDNGYVHAPPDAFASAWSALEGVSADNGGLFVYPGSHHEPILPLVEEASFTPSESQDPNAHRLRAVLPPGYTAVSLVAHPGDVVFLHAHLVHGSHANRTPSTYRHVFLATYLRKGEPFNPGNHAKRDEVDVY